MAVEVPQNEKISGGGIIKGKKESVLLSVGKEEIGGAQTSKNDSEKELFREMLIPT